MSEIILYKNSSDRKKVKKDLSKIVEVTETFRIKEPSSIVNPVVTLSKNTVGTSWVTANYAYIPMFKRYYFIDDIVACNDGIIEFHLTVDPLMTYKDGLLSTKFEFVRAEALNSRLFIDPELPIQGNKLLTYKILGSIPESGSNNYILTVAGG